MLHTTSSDRHHVGGACHGNEVTDDVNSVDDDAGYRDADDDQTIDRNGPSLSLTSTVNLRPVSRQRNYCKVSSLSALL